jgi:hypothetical protein
MGIPCLGIVGIGVQQATPAAPYSDNGMAGFADSIDYSLDARVQAGNVAAAGEYADAHDASVG